MTTGREPFATRQALLEAADAAWTRFTGVLEAWPEGELHGSGSGWTARDEYAHHARWLERSLQMLRARVEGTAAPEPEHYAVLNERWQAADRALTLEAAKGRCIEAREAMLAYVRAIPEERLEAEMMRVASDDPVSHLDAHVGYIVDALLADEETLWQCMFEALDRAGDGPAHREGDGWDVRDVWAHLGRWMLRAADVVEAHLEGRAWEPVRDIDAVNAAWRTEDGSLSRSEARQRAMAAHARIRGLMDSVPRERWDGRVFVTFGANTAGHYREHLAYMGTEA